MRPEPIDQMRAPRRIRRTAGDRLREAIQAMTGGQADIQRHAERPWASITFAGCRHNFTIGFSGVQAVEAGEHFIAELPDHEFTIAGQLVAEASITAVEHDLLPIPYMLVECEVLMLEDV